MVKIVILLIVFVSLAPDKRQDYHTLNETIYQITNQENYSEIRVQNFINELSEEEKECLNRIDGNNSKKLFAYMEEQSSDTSSFYPKEAQEFGRFAIGAFCEDFHETDSFEELLEVLDYEKKHFKKR